MVPVTPSFPLFKLPYLAWSNVLGSMNQLDLIQLSLCCKNMKYAVRSLFRKPNECCIEYEEGQLIIFVSGALSVAVGLQLCDLLHSGPCTMRFHEGRTIKLLGVENFRPKNWFDHIVGVFNVQRISSLSFKIIPSFELIDPRILRNLTEGLEISQLNTSTNVRTYNIGLLLDTFPNIQNLRLSLKPGSLPQIVERKYNSIYFVFSISVNEILSLKAKFISVPVYDYEFNKVLKKWVEGWHPLLTGMKLRLQRWEEPTTVFEGVFDGIDHQGPLITEKGIQFTIKNSKGISATITFNKPTKVVVLAPNQVKTTDVDMLVADHQL
ncbi:hypothetical protein CAEBREN_04963 [Caenorhabditis brenneri]|uniref:F-box domain-containing protein n=1 Tax=Caenorhabditis brenneri TaxID=135651 RepID=G0N877_CAEBE|nr:hypothetical protein CAEBREN_04963 [Caenorhabditis brenneri]